MGRAKEIEVRVIPSSIAKPFIRRHHYSHKIVNNSKLHFGAFLDGKLHGVMSYGASLDKAKMQGLVEGTGWNEFLELTAWRSTNTFRETAKAVASALACG